MDKKELINFEKIASLFNKKNFVTKLSIRNEKINILKKSKNKTGVFL